MSPPPLRVLVSGFESFAGLAYNPSQDVVETLVRGAESGQLITQREHGLVLLHTLVLPVEFGRAGKLLTAAVDEHQPDVVISVGLAAGTGSVRLERVGLNLRDARIPDNSGAQPLSEPIMEEGQNAYFSTLRLKAAEQRIAEAGIPVTLSLSAGSYLCNEVLYTLLHHLVGSQLPTAAGFMHIPDLRSLDSPVTCAQATDALDMVITEALKPDPDAATAVGALH